MTSNKIFWIAFFPIMILNIIVNVINVRSDAVHGFFSIFMHGLSLVLVIVQVLLVIMMFRALKKEKREKEKE